MDASICVKWFLPEPDAADAALLRDRALRDELALVAPDFVLVEVGNVFWLACQRGGLKPTEADAFLTRLAQGAVGLLSSRRLVHQALGLATRTGRSVYDCLYLAAAEELDSPLVTADARFARGVSGTPYASRVSLLSTFVKRR